MARDVDLLVTGGRSLAVMTLAENNKTKRKRELNMAVVVAPVPLKKEDDGLDIMATTIATEWTGNRKRDNMVGGRWSLLSLVQLFFLPCLHVHALTVSSGCSGHFPVTVKLHVLFGRVATF
jgi:hypothetical protein